MREQRAKSKQQRIISTKYSEGGFVSIFSIMIIMTILTLIAIGFSNITRQSERRTLDNQLSTQAFYSAEAGVNDAAAALLDTPDLTKDECQGPILGFNYVLDATLDVGYTCVLINPHPTNLQFSSVPVEEVGQGVKVVPLESANGRDITHFDVTWGPDATGAGSGGIPSDSGYPDILVPSETWGNKLGMVRVDVIPTDYPTFERATMVNESYVFLLYPSTQATSNNHTVRSGVTAGGSGENQGALLPVRCAAAPCTTTIRLRPRAGGRLSSKYILRLQALYTPVSVDINNVRDDRNNTVSLENGQILVDVTGRASDVYRRIQVRLPSTAETATTVAVKGLGAQLALLTADTICKRLKVADAPTHTTVDGTVSNLAPCQFDN